MMSMVCFFRWLKRGLWGLAAVVASAILVVFVVASLLVLRVDVTKRPKLLGNSPEVVERTVAATDPDDFTFYVTGDTQKGTETFEKLLKIIAEDRPDFLVIVGDFVHRPDPARHRLFIQEIAEHHLPFPVFLVPGNHDLHPSSAFGVAEFERLYGASQFHFTVGRNLFLILNGSPPYDTAGGYLDHMERVLAEQAGQAEHVFVFMHVPPTGLSPNVRARDLDGSERFRELARKYGVDYVFCGDHHGYWKGKRDGTTYVVCGGGGSRLRGTRGRFHHAVRVAVDGGSVADTVVAVEYEERGMESIERSIVVRHWPTLTRNWAPGGLTALCLALSMSVLVVSATRWRRRKAKPGH